jgi:hypothetical protein
VEERHVAEHLVEHAGGPPAVGDPGAALVVRGAGDAEPGDAVGAEALGGEPEPALPRPSAGAAQGHTAIGAWRLLEVPSRPL